MSAFPPIGDLLPSAAGGARSSSIDKNLLSQLESAYIEWREYDDGSAGMVTMDVYVAVTAKAVTDYVSYHDVPVTTPSRHVG